LAEVIIDPRFSVVEILTRNSVIPHQEATPDGAIENVSDRDLVGIKNFVSVQSDRIWFAPLAMADYRLYFAKDGNELIILFCGGTKSRQ
jgi:hypothetical protein